MFVPGTPTPLRQPTQLETTGARAGLARIQGALATEKARPVTGPRKARAMLLERHPGGAVRSRRQVLVGGKLLGGVRIGARARAAEAFPVEGNPEPRTIRQVDEA